MSFANSMHRRRRRIGWWVLPVFAPLTDVSACGLRHLDACGIRLMR
jgi:hypothetical protein